MTDEQLIELILQSEDPRKIIREVGRILSPKPKLLVCKAGLHKMTPENTYVNAASGSRYCRECRAIRDRERWKSTGAGHAKRTNFNRTIRDKAIRNGYVWTGPELELVARKDLTAKQVAEMLGRTLFAVKTARHKLRDDPGREILLAGVRND